MQAAHSPTTQSPIYGNFPSTSVSTTQPSNEGAVYAQVQPSLPEQAISDRTLMRFDTETAHVFPHQLLRLPEHFGLPESPELKQLGLTQATRANATVLPSDGMGGRSMVLADPGLELANPGTKERIARFGAALISEGVAHVVCANQTSTRANVQLPIGQKLQLAGQGGPLEMAFEQSSVDGAGASQFHIDARLPSGGKERSTDIGLWTLNLGEAAVADVQATLKALYAASDGQNVAFCCRGGNTRSGAAALLFHQRKTAEEAFKRGEVPKTAHLVNAALTWEKECKAVRSKTFAGNMPEGFLNGHAQALVAEMTERLAEKSKARPALHPKPVQTVRPDQQPQRHQAAAHQLTPPTAQRRDARPETAPKPGASSGAMASAISGAMAGARPQPTPSPRTKSLDTESVTSDFNDAASTSSLDSEGQPFDRLRDRAKPKLTPVQSYPYNAPAGQGKPLADVPVTPAKDPLPNVQEEPRHDSLEASSAQAQAANPSVEYSLPWDMRTLDLTGPGARQLDDRGRLRQSFNHMSKMTRDLSVNLRAQSRAGENLYSVAREMEPAMPAVNRSLADWEQGSHVRTQDLKAYVHGLALAFTQEAKQGFRPFVAKNTYGVGKAIEAVKNEAGNEIWRELAKDLQTTIDQASSDQVQITNGILLTLMEQGLAKEFDRLEPKMKETWLRRIGKTELNASIRHMYDQVAAAQKELQQSRTPAPEQTRQLQKLTLTMLSFHALHLVGSNPTRVP